MKERTKLALKVEGVLIGILSIMVALWFLCSCTTTRYVTVPEVHEQHHWHTDSVHKTDSVIHEKQTTIRELDSAAMAQYGIQIRQNEKAWLVMSNELRREIERLEAMCSDRDTVRDSIPKPYPVEVIKEVPRQKTWLERVMFTIGIIAIMLLILFVVNKLKRFLP